MPETSGEAISLEFDDAKRRRRHFRWWYTVLILLVLLALGLLSRRFYWRRQFEARVAALEAAGYPVRAEQLEAMYPPLPPGQANAADLLREAAELYRDSLSVQQVKLLPLAGDGEMPARGQPIPPDVKEIVTRFLDENRGGLERLHRAAGLDGCRYPVRWSFDDATDWGGLRSDGISGTRWGFVRRCSRVVYGCHADCPDRMCAGGSGGRAASPGQRRFAGDPCRLRPGFS